MGKLNLQKKVKTKNKENPNKTLIKNKNKKNDWQIESLNKKDIKNKFSEWKIEVSNPEWQVVSENLKPIVSSKNIPTSSEWVVEENNLTNLDSKKDKKLNQNGNQKPKKDKLKKINIENSPGEISKRNQKIKSNDNLNSEETFLLKNNCKNFSSFLETIDDEDSLLNENSCDLNLSDIPFDKINESCQKINLSDLFSNSKETSKVSKERFVKNEKSQVFNLEKNVESKIKKVFEDNDKQTNISKVLMTQNKKIKSNRKKKENDNYSESFSKNSNDIDLVDESNENIIQMEIYENNIVINLENTPKEMNQNSNKKMIKIEDTRVTKLDESNNDKKIENEVLESQNKKIKLNHNKNIDMEIKNRKNKFFENIFQNNIIDLDNTSNKNSRENIEQMEISEDSSMIILGNKKQLNNLENKTEEESKIVDDLSAIVIDSDKEINFVDLDDSDEEEKETNQTMIDLNNNCKVNLIKKSCTIQLKIGQSIMIEGRAKLKSISGTFLVLGYELTNNKEVYLYSPNGFSKLLIQAIDSSNKELDVIQIKDEANLLELEYFNKPLFKNLDYYFSEQIFPKIYHFKNIPENILQSFIRYPDFCENNGHFTADDKWKYILKSIYKNLKFLDKTDSDRSNSKLDSTKIIDLTEHSNDKITLDINLATLPVDENIPDVTILSGGKGVGKSTLLRYLINDLLKFTPVLCVDLDPGQSEFNICGCLSATLIKEPLLGPNFTHLKTPEKSFFIGDINVLNCSDRYVEATKLLYNYCKENSEYKTVPWIINTMGFTECLGLNLLITILVVFKPVRLVQIKSLTNAKNNFDNYLTFEYVKDYLETSKEYCNSEINQYEWILCESQSENIKHKRVFSPKCNRDIVIVSYFSEMFDQDFIEKPLHSIMPYRIKKSDIQLVSVSSIHINEQNLESVLNCTLVALCSKKLSASHLYECLGFGIVRGIDDCYIYIITPLAEDVLSEVNYLIKSQTINLPQNMLIKNTLENVILPYVSTFERHQTTRIPKRSVYHPKYFIKKHA